MLSEELEVGARGGGANLAFLYFNNRYIHHVRKVREGGGGELQGTLNENQIQFID